MNIKYTKNLDNITEEMLKGFFADWSNPPSSETHMKVLKDSYCSYIAIDQDSKKAVGFVNSQVTTFI